MPQRSPSEPMSFQVAGRSNEELAALLAAPAAPERRAPSLQIVGAIAPAAVKLSLGPAVIVRIPNAAKTWLAARAAAKDDAATAIDARWRGRQQEPEAWSRRGAEHRASAARYAVDVDAIENRAALAAAQAVEQEWQSTLDTLRALFPAQGESSAYY